jgi:uncharacterized protein YraI
MVKQSLARLIIISFVLSACSPAVIKPVAGTPSPVIPTTQPSSTSAPSTTPLPPAPTNTPQPLSGLSLWQVNVRSGPGIAFSLLGQINQDQPVQITGVDASQEWLAIIYPTGSQSRGWVTAEYIQASGIDNLPVLGLVTLPNGTPAPQAHLTQKINVRSGPATHYDSLGILPNDSLVWLIGRNQSASWLLIDYQPAPGGKGWIIAGFVKADDLFALPIVDASGVPLVDTPLPQGTVISSTSTPNLEPAYQDGDTAIKPGASVVFSPLGIQSFSFGSDLSSPQGDSEDWIAFQPYSSKPGGPASLSASLSCTGNGSVLVEIWQDGQPISNWGDLSCGISSGILTLDGDSKYLFHLSIGAGTGFRYVLYSLSVHNNP